MTRCLHRIWPCFPMSVITIFLSENNTKWEDTSAVRRRERNALLPEHNRVMEANKGGTKALHEQKTIRMRRTHWLWTWPSVLAVSLLPHLWGCFYSARSSVGVYLSCCPLQDFGAILGWTNMMGISYRARNKHHYMEHTAADMSACNLSEGKFWATCAKQNQSQPESEVQRYPNWANAVSFSRSQVKNMGT